jgi:murein DD-endopeptidase MepM/ murein hydrolase activator NlpD
MMLNFAQKKILRYTAIFLAGIVIVPAAEANRLETFLLDKSRNRIEFTTQNQVQPLGQIIENPTRLVIDLPNATFTGPTVRRNNIGTIIQSLRVGKLDPVGTRLVVEFAPNFNANLLDEQPLKLEAISPSRWSIQFPSAIATRLQNTITSFIMPTVGEVSSPFGWRINPVTGKRQLHKGIDIAAPIGAPILAAASGIVNDAGWDDGGYGNFVELRHSDGSLTLYAHTNRVLVAKGQEISQGQIIAEVGNTGRSTGPHLHFEVQIGRQVVDPTPFIHSDLVILNLASR